MPALWQLTALFTLLRFVCEACKCDGSDFPPRTLKYILIVVQMHLKSMGTLHNFLDDAEFHRLAMCLDNKMKENALKDLGHKVKQAQALDVSDVFKLWEEGMLGKSNPKQLSQTVV